MAKPKIGIVVGSTRPNRFADQPTEWIEKIARARGDIEVEVVDLRDYPMPFFNEPASPAWAPSQNEVARKWQKKVAELDGFIFITAEYNRGPTAVLKNAIDYAYNEWNKKAVTFVGYGGVGAARAVEQLRLNAVELQMAPTRAAVHILLPDFIAVLQQGRKLEEIDHLNQSAQQVLDQLVWWTSGAEGSARQRHPDRRDQGRLSAYRSLSSRQRRGCSTSPSPLVGEGGSAPRAQRGAPRRLRGVGRSATLPGLRVCRVNLLMQVSRFASRRFIHILPQTSAKVCDARQHSRSANTPHPTAPPLRCGSATFSHKGRRTGCAALASPFVVSADRLGSVEIQVRASRKWWHSRTGAERTFRT